MRLFMQDERQLPQAKRSLARVTGTAIWSPHGRYIFNIVYLLIFGAFVSFSSWSASSDQSLSVFRVLYANMVTKIYQTQIENRCIGLAILERVSKGQLPAPAWCVAPLERIRTNEPEPLVSLEDALKGAAEQAKVIQPEKVVPQ